MIFPYDPGCLMTVNNLSIALNMPPALKSIIRGGEEIAQKLPYYAPLRVHRAADYEGKPGDWIMPRATNEGTFFFCVPDEIEGQPPALWIDGGPLDRSPYDTAFTVSFQGVDAITGLEKKSPYLLKIEKNCPKHQETQLTPAGYCKDCNFTWPPQNYRARSADCIKVNGRWVLFHWLDGWNLGENVIRQLVFTRQQDKIVARHVIGDRLVDALAIAVFRSRQPWQRPADDVVLRRADPFQKKSWNTDGILKEIDSEPMRSMSHSFENEVRGRPKPRIGAAAGTKIIQRIPKDLNPIDYWEEEPSAIFRVYWVDQDQLKEILATKIGGTGESWLARSKIPVGNAGGDPISM